MYQIVDTNVLLVASKKAPQASETCELACEKFLQNLIPEFSKMTLLSFPNLPLLKNSIHPIANLWRLP